MRDIWSATSFNELRRDGMSAERWNLLHPDETAAQELRRDRRSKDMPGRSIAATDYMRNYAEQMRRHIPRRYVVLGTDGFGRSDYRVEAAQVLRSEPALRRGRGAEGAGGRRRDRGRRRRPGDQEVRRSTPSVRIPGPSEARAHGIIRNNTKDASRWQQ